jgi:2-oxoglutarate ferredoxin oxidoreductase subunit alpha
MADLQSIAIAIVGSGGAGALTAGNLLLEAACAAGWQGLLTRWVGPQIRGGEAAALLRLSGEPVECMADRLDVLIGIDWLNAERFGAELQVAPGGLVIGDPRGGALPSQVAAAGARVAPVPMKDMAKAIPEGRANMIALGVAGQLLGMSEDIWPAFLAKRLEGRGRAAVEGSLASLKAGYEAARGMGVQLDALPRAGIAARGGSSLATAGRGAGRYRGGIRCGGLSHHAGHRGSQNGSPTSPRWAVYCCRPRTSWRRST